MKKNIRLRRFLKIVKCLQLFYRKCKIAKTLFTLQENDCFPPNGEVTEQNNFDKICDSNNNLDQKEK